MASGVEVRPSLVNCAVDLETRCVHSDFVTTNDLPILVDVDHIAGFQHSEVLTEPESNISDIVQNE